jgi:hypothetical protein
MTSKTKKVLYQVIADAAPSIMVCRKYFIKNAKLFVSSN